MALFDYADENNKRELLIRCLTDFTLFKRNASVPLVVKSYLGAGLKILRNGAFNPPKRKYLKFYEN